MNRHLGEVDRFSASQFSAREQQLNRFATVHEKHEVGPVTILDIVEKWKKTKNKEPCLKMLGQLFRQYNKEHDDDLLK